MKLYKGSEDICIDLHQYAYYGDNIICLTLRGKGAGKLKLTEFEYTVGGNRLVGGFELNI